jgi:hypothetical protein
MESRRRHLKDRKYSAAQAGGVTLEVNHPNPIEHWRSSPQQRALDKKLGWDVVFARARDGSIPALDYLEGKDSASDRDWPVTPKQLNRFAAFVEKIRFEGPNSLKIGDQYKPFKGADADHGMCELIITRDCGHRWLCFKRAGRQFVVGCGFRKPPQKETPREAKTRAVRILEEHEDRIA